MFEGAHLAPGVAPAWSHFGDRVIITPSLQWGTLRCRQVQGQAPITPPGGSSPGVKPRALPLPSAASAGDPLLPAQRGHLGLGMGTTCSSLWAAPSPHRNHLVLQPRVLQAKGGLSQHSQGGLSWGNRSGPAEDAAGQETPLQEAGTRLLPRPRPCARDDHGAAGHAGAPQATQPANLRKKPPAAPWSRAREQGCDGRPRSSEPG